MQAVAIASLVAVGDAHAHPLGDRAASQTTELVVHPDRVDVDYVADVPTAYVATVRGRLRAGTEPDPAGADPVGAMAVELASGLLLTVDGAVVSMTIREPSPPPAPTSEHTVGITLHLTAPLPDGPWPHRIEVSTANLQEGTNFYAGDIRVDARIGVEASSLLGERDGRIVRDDTLRWIPGEEHRRQWVTVAAPRPAWWSFVAALPAEPVRVGKAWIAPLPARMRPPALTPAAWFGGLGAAAALGLAAPSAGASAGRRVRGELLGIAAVGVVAAWAAPARGSGWVEAVGAVVAAGIGAGAGLATARGARSAAAWRGAAFAAAAGALAAATAATVAGAGLWAGFALGMATGTAVRTGSSPPPWAPGGGKPQGDRANGLEAFGVGAAALAIAALAVRAWLGLR